MSVEAFVALVAFGFRFFFGVFVRQLQGGN